jgi:hypothetical protein
LELKKYKKTKNKIMGSLTYEQIKNTYQGLLKLEDSSSGITSTYQPIQDGLGNDTGVLIRENGIKSPTTYAINPFKGDFYGPGFVNTASAPVATSQNSIINQIFYDSGLNSYSAITYNVFANTSTSDVVSVAFYTPQYVDGYGFVPGELIMSGITLVSNSTGVKTTSLPSTLSFSGYGGGWYFMSYIISNGGVTPTIRYTNPTITANLQSNSPASSIGFTFNTAQTALVSQFRTNTITATGVVFQLNYSSFSASFSANDIITGIGSSSSTFLAIGFGLNTIK